MVLLLLGVGVHNGAWVDGVVAVGHDEESRMDRDRKRHQMSHKPN